MKAACVDKCKENKLFNGQMSKFYVNGQIFSTSLFMFGNDVFGTDLGGAFRTVTSQGRMCKEISFLVYIDQKSVILQTADVPHMTSHPSLR